MTISISCRELGMDCRFVGEAEDEDALLELLMEHVRNGHEVDWYEDEEIYDAAREFLRRKAA